MPEAKPSLFTIDDSSEDVSSNPTDNPTFREIARETLSRRKVLKGSLATAAAGFLAPAPAFPGGAEERGDRPLLDFEELTIEAARANGGLMPTISPDYEYDVLIPWGTPINPNLGIEPYEGDPASRPTPKEQEQMVGIGHDGMWLFPANLPVVLEVEALHGKRLPEDVRNKLLSSYRGLLCVNHEFGNNFHVLGKPEPENLEDVRLSQAAHGVSVVTVGQAWNGKWELKQSWRNRRITVNTPVTFSGPVAGSPLLHNAANNEPLGTVNNCGSGPTPWGTYVTCEENFNGYFGSTEFSGDDDNVRFDSSLDEIIEDPTAPPAAKQRASALKRYGFDRDGFGYNWFNYDPRFDLSNPDYANEPNRFGWCVEIDPFKPWKKPVKRTALGRFKHEAAAFKELDDGRVAVYMGDDERGDYCYKYESNKPWRDAVAAGQSPLDDGRLYVAQFTPGGFDNNGIGYGKWLELTINDPVIQAAGFGSQAEVLTFARLAAAALGATPMYGPDWSPIGTRGEVYWTLTNNDRKDDGAGAVSEVNPIFENKDGYIIETEDMAPRWFKWKMFVIARNTRGTDPETGSPEDFPYAEYSAPADGGESVFTDPDAAYADPQGRLFIGTDGGQPEELQDQLLVFDTTTGEHRRLLMGVNDDEITGLTSTPDYRTLFTNSQHAGDGNPLATSFPAPYDGITIPRDATIVIRRKDGGVVGS